MNIKTILMIIIMIGVLAFSWFFYTPTVLKKAEIKYNEEKIKLSSKNEALEKEIALINENKIKIEKELKLEKENAVQLEKRLAETRIALANIQGGIKKMTDSDVVKDTRNILGQNIQESSDGKGPLSNSDLFQQNEKVIWSFFPMKVNLRILKEYNNFKTIIPTLEEKCTGLEKQRDHYDDLYREEQRISQKRQEQYANENKLRLASEDLYAACKRQFKTEKTKGLLIGGGVGLGVAILVALLK